MPKSSATPEFARTHPALSIKQALDEHIQIGERLQEYASEWVEYAHRLEAQRNEARSLLEDALEAVRKAEEPRRSGVPQETTSWDKALAEGVRTSLAGRIKIGMMVKGIAGGQALADVINRVAPELKKLNRKTTAKWLSGEVKNIELARFIALAQALDVDPEWLVTGKGEPQRVSRRPLEQHEHIRLTELREHATAWSEYARQLEVQRDEAKSLLQSALEAVVKVDWPTATVVAPIRALPAKAKDEA
jgi:transcriptional regulator with XRE-family HTH domain